MRSGGNVTVVSVTRTEAPQTKTATPFVASGGGSGNTALIEVDDVGVRGPKGDGANTPFAVWPSGTLRTMQQRATDTYCILDAPGNPDPTGANDSTAALKAMFAEAASSGVAMELTVGDFVTHEPLLIKHVGQVLHGHGMGYGMGGTYALRDFQPQSRIIGAGAFARRIMTRRLYRASAADPQDTPMSAVLEVHAEGAHLSNLCVWLNGDYNNLSPTNLGDDIDVGLFISRLNVVTSEVAVMGYFRKAGIYHDITRDPARLPELLDPDGNPLPVGSAPYSAGGDGCSHFNPMVRGGRVGMALIGAIHPGGDYYDEGLGATATDQRGGTGFSDFNVFGGLIRGGSHHSGRRLADPIAVPLTQANLDAEDTFAPSSLIIDGWASNAGNTSHGIGAIRGMCFFATNWSTPEMFRVRLGTCDEVYFVGRGHSDGGSGGTTVTDTAGAPVNVNDYVNATYGHFSTHSVNTGYVYLQHPTGGMIAKTWMQPGHFAGEGIGTVVAQEAILQGDTDAHSRPLLQLIDDSVTSGVYEHLLVKALRPKIRFDDTTGGAVDWDLLVNSSFFQIMSGDAVPNTNMANVRLQISGASGHISPGADNLQNFGSAVARLSNIYGTQFRPGAGTPIWTSGAGSPESAVIAPVGSLYTRTDGSTAATLYVKETGAGNTGWISFGAGGGGGGGITDAPNDAKPYVRKSLGWDDFTDDMALKANLAGATFTGKIMALPSATGGAGFNLGAGAAPSSPAFGDIWISGNLIQYYNGTLINVLNNSTAQNVGGIKTFTVSPILPTPTAGDNSTAGATTAFVTTAIAAKITNKITVASTAPGSPATNDIWVDTT